MSTPSNETGNLKLLHERKTDKLVLRLTINADKTKLYIEADPVGNCAQINRSTLLDFIKEKIDPERVNLGVIDDVLQYIKRREVVPARRIVVAKAPEPGTDGKLLLLVKKFGGQGVLKIAEDAKGSLQELHLFDNVLKGQSVARIYLPRAGKDGMDVLGNVIPSKPGAPVKIVLDKTLEVSKTEKLPEGEVSYDVVTTKVDGYLVEESGKLLVKEELVIDDNLDLHYGNIDFIGAVKITGDVMPGFNVKAKTKIEILGDVRGGSLVCTQGPIVVKGFVYGGANSRVISGDSFTANLVQEITAEIRGDIIINKECQNSNLRSGGTLQMGKARLFGGKAYSVCGGEFKILGNEVEVDTYLSVCSDIEATVEYGDILGQLAMHLEAEKLLTLHLGPYATNPTRIPMLNEPIRTKTKKLYDKLQQVLSGKQRLEDDRTKMLAQASSNDVLRVNVIEKLNRGVRIQVGEEIYTPADTVKGPVSVDFVDGKFTVGSIKALECNIAKIKEKRSKDDQGNST